MAVDLNDLYSNIRVIEKMVEQQSKRMLRLIDLQYKSSIIIDILEKRIEELERQNNETRNDCRNDD